MVHWDCDSDFTQDRKTSNERLVDIVCCNDGRLLKEWMSVDCKKEPMCKAVLEEFHKQGAKHRRTTRDIRNAMTQLLKKFESTKQYIEFLSKEADSVYNISHGIPSYPKGQLAFETAVKEKFPFYFMLLPYLNNYISSTGSNSTNDGNNKKEVLDSNKTRTSSSHITMKECKDNLDREITDLQVMETSRHSVVRQNKNGRTKLENNLNNANVFIDLESQKKNNEMLQPVSDYCPDSSSTESFQNSQQKTGELLPKRKYNSEDYYEIKRRKLKLKHQQFLIDYQAKAIELTARYCSNLECDKLELRQMIKHFSASAFPSIDFSLGERITTSNIQNEDDVDELSYSDG